jgi:hypothetical protein
VGTPSAPTVSLADQLYRRDLGEGLLLRWSTADDADRLCQLYADVYRDAPNAPLNQRVPIWVRDMMSGRHPLITPGEFAVVEHTGTGAIVAATCLLGQSWQYAGIQIAIGRPEAVATDPAYRNRGLIRQIFELIHVRSVERGHLVQAITGIPYFYRQFGYEYALDLDVWRVVPFSVIPPLQGEAGEPFRLRDATPVDLPQAVALYDRERASAVISTPIDEGYWRWVLEGMDAHSGHGWHTHMILEADGRSVGYVLTGRTRWARAIDVLGLSVEPGVSLVAVLPSVLRALQTLAPALPVHSPDAPPPNSVAFGLGSAHPVYEALVGPLAPTSLPPYAWYVRVPDLPAFVRRIAPALERRLAGSAAAGYSGELTLNFYRGGLRLVFEQGRLAAAEDWHLPLWGKAQAGFPPLVFLQLLFGHRSLGELHHAYPDVWASDEVAPVVTALFPPQRSFVHALE